MNKLHIDYMEVSPRTYNSLKNAGHLYVDDILKMSRDQFLSIKGIGPFCLNDIRSLFHVYGIDFAPPFPTEQLNAWKAKEANLESDCIARLENYRQLK